MLKDIGKIIRYHRKKAKLSQIELAHLANLGKATVFDIEKGKMTVQLDNVIKILSVLNIEIKFHSPLMEQYERDIK